MNVQKFIAENGVYALTEHFGVTVKQYPHDYFKLNYDQIESPKFHPISDECRGLILKVDIDNRSKVVCRCLPRFYNYGEGDTKNFNFANSVIQEKLDGSLTFLWYSPDEQKWCIGTRGMAYAEGNYTFSLNASGGTFYDWILRAMGVTEEEFQRQMESCPKEVTIVMEYCSEYNRIVTKYPNSFMGLLAVLDNETGTEEALNGWLMFFSSWMQVRLPKTYTASSADEVVLLVNSFKELEEGFVCRDRDTGDRVKVKSEQYVIAHKLRGNGTPTLNNLMELVLTNEQDELLAYFDDMKLFVDPVVAAYEMLRSEFSFYDDFKDLESQKDFALSVKDHKLAPVMFKARKDKVSPSIAFNNMELSQKVKMLEKYCG